MVVCLWGQLEAQLLFQESEDQLIPLKDSSEGGIIPLPYIQILKFDIFLASEPNKPYIYDDDKLVYQLLVKQNADPQRMADLDVLNSFQEINIETPVDKLIRQIRSLITSGQLKPGDRLPPERKLADRLGVSRTNVRQAIRKLEFYGILKTLPQSGTVVAGLGIPAFEGLISDVLKIEDSDFASLIETRILLESQSAYYAAQRREPADILKIEKTLIAYEAKVKAGEQAVEEDLLFHLKIAECSKNSVLKSLMLIIIPDIIKNFIKLDVCTDNRLNRAHDEHRVILTHIVNQEPEKAAEAMREHLKDVYQYSKNLRLKNENGGV